MKNAGITFAWKPDFWEGKKKGVRTPFRIRCTSPEPGVRHHPSFPSELCCIEQDLPDCLLEHTCHRANAKRNNEMKKKRKTLPRSQRFRVFRERRGISLGPGMHNPAHRFLLPASPSLSLVVSLRHPSKSLTFQPLQPERRKEGCRIQILSTPRQREARAVRTSGQNLRASAGGP